MTSKYLLEHSTGFSAVTVIWAPRTLAREKEYLQKIAWSTAFCPESPVLVYFL
jgi:hypothetical protein